ncbi:MAG TPA: type III restriction endonuclease subunit R, partial [Myxococcota bacterium]|nr:type III restriction endonuclease subunit R [Myxococcota bacterium]
FIDTHAMVDAFVKNAGLGLGIDYIHDGGQHEYIPDFVIRLKAESISERYLLLETKGFDPLKEVKAAAARRWCAAVNSDGSYGHWEYRIAESPESVRKIIDEVCMRT